MTWFKISAFSPVVLITCLIRFISADILNSRLNVYAHLLSLSLSFEHTHHVDTTIACPRAVKQTYLRCASTHVITTLISWLTQPVQSVGRSAYDWLWNIRCVCGSPRTFRPSSILPALPQFINSRGTWVEVLREEDGENHRAPQRAISNLPERALSLSRELYYSRDNLRRAWYIRSEFTRRHCLGLPLFMGRSRLPKNGRNALRELASERVNARVRLRTLWCE